MRILMAIAALALAACAAPGGGGGGGALRPASPQPDAGALRPGLAVEYAYPVDIRMLSEARRMRGVTQTGAPLKGFDYPDTERGENALTSRQPERVVAFIDGFIRFDRAGAHRLQFWSNDGLEVRIGGAEVYRHDRRHTCQTLGWRTVNVPEPGWYRVEALFFQRLNTSCLMLNWTPPGGGEGRVPAANFAHLPG